MSKVKRPKPRATQPVPEPWKPLGDTRSAFHPVWMCMACLSLGFFAWLAYKDCTPRLFFDDLSSIQFNENVHVLANPAKRWEWATWKKATMIDVVDNPLSGRPVVALSFALNHWYAYWQNPSVRSNDFGVNERHFKSFKNVNLAMHVVVTMLVFLLVRRTLSAPVFNGRFRDSGVAWAFALALLWGLHPLNTETVTYVTQRTELVLSLFFISTFLCSALALDMRGQTGRIAWQAAAVLLCALGMASKENMAAAPLLLVLYDRAFRFGSWKEVFASQWRFYLCIYSTYAILLLINGGALPGFRQMSPPELLLPLYFVYGFLCATMVRGAESKGARIAWQTAAAILFGVGMAVAMKSVVARMFADAAGREALTAAASIAAAVIVGAATASMPLLTALYERLASKDKWREAVSGQTWFYAAAYSIFALCLSLGVGNNAVARLDFFGPSLGHPRGESVGFHHDKLSALEYLITQCWCLWRYVWLSIIPLHTKMSVDYGRRAVLDFWNTAPGATMVLGFLALTVWGWIKKPWVGFLGAWFFIILAPTSSFYPIVTEVGAERRMYLPLLAILAGVIVLAAMLVRELLDRILRRGTEERFTVAVITYVVLIAGIGIFLGVSSHERNKVYNQDATAYGHIHDVFPENDRGCNNFAKICLDNQQQAQGLKLLNHAVYIDPEYSDAFTNRAIVFHQSRRFDVAIANSTEAIKWNPYNVSAWNNRGNAFMELKDFERALYDFSKVIAITRNPATGKGSPDGYFGRANVYFMMGELDPKNYDLAMQDVESALSINKDDYKALNTKGNILKKLGRPQEAVKAFDDAIQAVENEARSVLEPDSITMKSWEALKKILETIDYGNYNVQRAEWELAVRYPNRGTVAAILGNRADAHNECYKLSRDRGDLKKVMDDISRAIVLDKSNAQYWLVRAQFNMMEGQNGAALMDLNEVLNLVPNSPDVLAMHLKLAFTGGMYPEAVQDVVRMHMLNARPDPSIVSRLHQMLTAQFFQAYYDGNKAAEIPEKQALYNKAVEAVVMLQQLGESISPDVVEGLSQIFAKRLRWAYDAKNYQEAMVQIGQLQQLKAPIDPDILEGLKPFIGNP